MFEPIMQFKCPLKFRPGNQSYEFPCMPPGNREAKVECSTGSCLKKRKADTAEEPSVKKLGRPKGSRNKSKETEAQRTFSAREMAELAAEGTNYC